MLQTFACSLSMGLVIHEEMSNTIEIPLAQQNSYPSLLLIAFIEGSQLL
jgi:hypothetical protein